MAFEPMPDRATAAERIRHNDADVREAAQKVEKRLRDRATAMHVTGWQEDEDTEFVVAERTIIGRLRITRGEANA